MIRTFLTISLSMIFCLANQAYGNDLKTYRSSGKNIMDQIISKKIDKPALSSEVDKMVQAAINLTKEYQKKHPSGKKVLQVVIDNIEKIKGMSFDEVEKQWHDLGYFEGKSFDLDLSDEDNEHFTDPIHCIVHPILTLKAGESYLKTKDQKHIQTMQEELSEGLEQVTNIENGLK